MQVSTGEFVTYLTIIVDGCSYEAGFGYCGCESPLAKHQNFATDDCYT
jgi:hypothetical protein